jgi:hypothetical protein
VPFTTLFRQRCVAPRVCQRRAARTHSAGSPAARMRASRPKAAGVAALFLQHRAQPRHRRLRVLRGRQ